VTPAVFLDRDGTLIDEVGYLDRLERLALFPYSIDAVRLLNRAGFRVVVVTNQAGVAHGLLDERFVTDTHRYLDEKLSAAGARVDGYYYCPHHPNAAVEAYRIKCECRKPGTGMIRNAARDFGLDIARSFVVGDRWLDIEMAQASGASGILVRTGYGKTEESRPRDGVKADAIVGNLMEATTWILRRLPRS
jgi:D-glycero-D-manno-heptose 1,7-bisphosphate phosphatase